MRIVYIFALLALTSCATLTGDDEQTLTLTTEPAGAICTVMGSENTHISEPTPTSIVVERAFQPLEITCDGSGAYGSATVEAGLRGRAYGNILMGGVPVLVDAATGDAYEYPDTVHIPLSATGGHIMIER